MNTPAPPQHQRPLWFAGLLTCLAVPLVYFLLLIVVGILTGDAFSGEIAFRALGFTLMIGFPVCVGAVFLLGLPIALVLRAQNALTAINVCVGAALIGMVALAVLFGVIQRGAPEFAAYAWGLVVGALAGVVFCEFAGIRWRRTVE